MVRLTHYTKTPRKHQVYRVSREALEKYVEAVKANGFTEVGFENSTSYRATNADGIEAHITYTDVEEKTTGCVDKNET